MKTHARVLIALTIIAFLTIPSSLVSQQLSTPVEKSVFPGVTTIQYANQTLVFTTSVPLRVRLSVPTPGTVLLRFKAEPRRGRLGPQGPSAGGNQTVVFWEQSAENVFNGDAPGDWTDISLREGGWTEK